ncbi:hypothetical protein [Streptomyces cucumeris]|uniref:hypothetical protein n=1 Tax=Streptomyces cucumeris TaxID=2962890 RepID=UPI003D72A276
MTDENPMANRPVPDSPTFDRDTFAYYGTGQDRQFAGVLYDSVLGQGEIEPGGRDTADGHIPADVDLDFDNDIDL